MLCIYFLVNSSLPRIISLPNPHAAVGLGFPFRLSPRRRPHDTIQGYISVTAVFLTPYQWHPTPVLLPGKSHGQRSLVGSSPRVAKSGERLSDFTLTFHFHALEKEMATHSSVLAWRIPGAGDPDGLPSMGSHRVGHNRSNLATAAATI